MRYAGMTPYFSMIAQTFEDLAGRTHSSLGEFTEVREPDQIWRQHGQDPSLRHCG